MPSWVSVPSWVKNTSIDLFTMSFWSLNNPSAPKVSAKVKKPEGRVQARVRGLSSRLSLSCPSSTKALEHVCASMFTVTASVTVSRSSEQPTRPARLMNPISPNPISPGFLSICRSISVILSIFNLHHQLCTVCSASCIVHCVKADCTELISTLLSTCILNMYVYS